MSINTLLGSPRQLICQCCGMPLEDGTLSREPDGSFHESYCKWCYAEGKFAYQSLDQLIDFMVGHVPGPDLPPEELRSFWRRQLSQLEHWKEA